MLVGYVDIARRDKISGWAAHSDDPDAVVDLIVLANGREAGRVRADRFRPDLKRLGRFGEGWHGFEFFFDPPLDPAQEFTVLVRFASVEAMPARGAFRFPRQDPGASIPAVEFYQPRQRPPPTEAAGDSAPSPPQETATVYRIGIVKPAAPRNPRELLTLLAGYEEAGDLARLFDQVDLAGVTPFQVHQAVFQQAPHRFRGAWAGQYDAKAAFIAALSAPEFRARAIGLFLAAHPEKRRLFFVHVPKCAGTDLREKLAPKFATLQHTIVSNDWMPNREMFAALGAAAREAEAGKDILLFGHIELDRYVAGAGTRFGDRIFTVIRDPVEIALSQANYAVSVIVNDRSAKLPHTRENLHKLGIRQLPVDAGPAQLKALALRAFLNPSITVPNPICRYLGGFGKGHAEAIRNIVLYDVEVTDTAHYNRWLVEEWGIDSATRKNSSIPFLAPADLEPHRDHLARLTGEDQRVYDLISWAIGKAGTASIGGLALLELVARHGGPYAVDFEHDLIERRPAAAPGTAGPASLYGRPDAPGTQAGPGRR